MTLTSLSPGPLSCPSGQHSAALQTSHQALQIQRVQNGAHHPSSQNSSSSPVWARNQYRFLPIAKARSQSTILDAVPPLYPDQQLLLTPSLPVCFPQPRWGFLSLPWLTGPAASPVSLPPHSTAGVSFQKSLLDSNTLLPESFH